MKSLTVPLLFSFLFFTPLLPTEASTTFVGNAGDGFLINGRAYLADLVLGGENMYLSPWTGSHPSRPFRVEPSLSEFLGVPPSLLEAKLRDADDIYNGLGHLIGDAIRMHQWSFTDLTLGSTCDRSPPIVDMDSSHIRNIQIANRYQGEIRLQKGLWQKMDDSHRVALLIHEGVYSLLNAFSSPRSCVSAEPANLVRKIVRLIYEPPSSKEKELTQEMLNSLRLTAGFERCFRFSTDSETPNLLQLRLALSGPGGEQVPSGQEPLAFKHRLPMTLKADDFYQGAVEICESAAAGFSPQMRVNLIVRRKPYWILPTATGLIVVERSSVRTLSYLWTDQRTCVANLMTFKEWMLDPAPLSEGARRPRAASCLE